MKKILIPNNNFTVLLMLMLLLMIVVVPLAGVSWLVSLAAPWWVAMPCGCLSAIVSFLVLVKFKK